MKSSLIFPRIYPIIDAAALNKSDAITAICDFAAELLAGGATFIQLRNKQGSAPEILSQARELRRIVSNQIKLIMNDHPDLCLAANFDGVHLGQEDLSVEGARKVVGANLIIGASTHNLQQLQEADKTSADYIAIGPIFATNSKSNPDPVVGLEFIRAARQLTRKPLVAIGGINRQNCRSVIEAGADSVAVISDLLESPQKRMQEFLRILG